MVVVGNSVVGEQLAHHLRVSWVGLTTEHFPDGESLLCFSDEHVGEDVLVFYQFANDRRMDSGVLDVLSLLRCLDGRHRIEVAFSYVPYTRSWPPHSSREIAKLLPLLHELGRVASRVYVVEPHCGVGALQEHTGTVPVVPVVLDDAVASFLVAHFPESFVVVSPDHGSAERVERLAALMSVPFLVLGKERSSAHEVRVGGETVAGGSRTAVIFDDIVSTGGTLRAAAAHLRDQGFERVACFVVHNVAQEGVLEALAEDGISFFTMDSLLHGGSCAVSVVPALGAAVGAPISV